MKITDLPFNQLIGITAPAEGTLSLSGDVRYTNHLGTVHASALLALAEAASGEWLIRAMPGVEGEMLTVVRRFEAKFRKPAMGAVFSEVTVGEEAKTEFISTLAARGKALLEIRIDVRDERGTHALSAAAEWFVARRD